MHSNNSYARYFKTWMPWQLGPHYPQPQEQHSQTCRKFPHVAHGVLLLASVTLKLISFRLFASKKLLSTRDTRWLKKNDLSMAKLKKPIHLLCWGTKMWSAMPWWWLPFGCHHRTNRCYDMGWKKFCAVCWFIQKVSKCRQSFIGHLTLIPTPWTIRQKALFQVYASRKKGYG